MPRNNGTARKTWRKERVEIFVPAQKRFGVRFWEEYISAPDQASRDRARENHMINLRYHTAMLEVAPYGKPGTSAA